jgi:hypothetical protein
MVGYDNRKVAQNRTSVKQDFGLPFSTLFQAQDRKEPQYVGDGTELLNFASTCHDQHCKNHPSYCINEKYIQASIIDRNLHPLSKSFPRRLQEET